MVGRKKRESDIPAPENVAVGEAIRRLRIRADKSQLSLSLDADLDRSYISQIETGQASPTFSTLYSLCGALMVSLVDLAALVQEILDGDNSKIETQNDRFRSP
jgi:transcriptional regulator with XRE-family HTH domain